MSKAGRSGFFDNPTFWDKIFRQPRISGHAGGIRLRQPRNLGQAGRGNVHGRPRFRQPRISGREVEIQPGGRTPAPAIIAVGKPHAGGRDAGLLIAGGTGAVGKPRAGGRDAGLLIAGARSPVSKPYMGAPDAGLLIAVAASAVSKPHAGGRNAGLLIAVTPLAASTPDRAPTSMRWFSREPLPEGKKSRTKSLDLNHGLSSTMFSKMLIKLETYLKGTSS
jgi:hypothetical protein